MEAEYKSIIELKRDISEEELAEMTRVIESAFRNRAGTALNTSDDPYVFIFEGNEPLYGCLHLAAFNIAENHKEIFDCITIWNWVDRDQPKDNEDLKKTFLYAGTKYGWWK